MLVARPVPPGADLATRYVGPSRQSGTGPSLRERAHRVGGSAIGRVSVQAQLRCLRSAAKHSPLAHCPAMADPPNPPWRLPAPANAPTTSEASRFSELAPWPVVASPSAAGRCRAPHFHRACKIQITQPAIAPPSAPAAPPRDRAPGLDRNPPFHGFETSNRRLRSIYPPYRWS